eukprot:SAG31_NODE_5170_length_2701_cov_3.885473_2_plen_49_part_00
MASGGYKDAGYQYVNLGAVDCPVHRARKDKNKKCVLIAARCTLHAVCR